MKTLLFIILGIFLLAMALPFITSIIMFIVMLFKNGKE